VEPDALPAWAEEHAASWLADRGARGDHVRGVARQAQRVIPALDEDDRPYLVAAAWLHDIRYAAALAATAFRSMVPATSAHSAMSALLAWSPTTRRLGGRPRPSA
jgi:HD superfamily phosphohydrolase YqeK